MFKPKFTNSNSGFAPGYVQDKSNIDTNFDGYEALKGEDGFSPDVEVIETSEGYDIIIKEKDGQLSFSIKNGKDGADGKDGKDGQQGPRGFKGDTGDRGEQGPIGPQGPTGPRGEAGPQGPKGNQGIQGPKGDKGDTGLRGPQGERGEQGPEGYTPRKGIDYFDGEKGEKGDTGPQGPQGVPGEKGDKGDTGPQGNRGAPGEKGDKGDPFTYNDFTTAQLEALRGPRGYDGQKGDKGDTGPKGDKGDTGDRGDTGPQGPRGVQGEQGPVGPQGPKGADGTMTFEDLTEEQKDSLKGEQGPKGDPGSAGKDGQPGKDGVDGFSPIISLSKSGKVTTLEITDKNGKQTAEIKDGEDGQGGEGGGGKAIIDVVELPTENIDDAFLYRLLTATFFWNGGAFNAYTCYVVETLPEVGEPATNFDMSMVTMYYTIEEQIVKGYITEELSMGLGVPVGWYDAGTLFAVADVPYAGVVAKPQDASQESSMYVVLEGTLFENQNGEWKALNQVGWRGAGNSAEIFNSVFNIANGNYSHAEGFMTVAGNIGSHAEGSYSHAEGYSSHAEGYYSHAEGYFSHAEGSYSHAEGRGEYIFLYLTGPANSTTYVNTSSFSSNIVVGQTIRLQRYGYQISDGRVGVTYSTAKITSIDFASRTITVDRTLSEVDINECYAIVYISGIAKGGYSHTEGIANISVGKCQHVQGEYNVQDVDNGEYNRSTYAHIVGNGTSHTSRSNAHTLDWDGLGWFAGGLKVGGTGQDDPNAKSIPTTDEVQQMINEALGVIENGSY